MRTFFAKKKAKSGKEFVYKDTEIDIYQIVNDDGVSLGKTLSNQEERIIKLENAITKITSAFSGGVKK